MNKDRRKRLQDALDKLDAAQTLVDEAVALAEDVLGEEQEAFDNLPEGLQMAERGEAMSAAISALESVGTEDIAGDIRANIEEAMA